MKLRRIVTVYTLAFGVPLVLLGSGPGQTGAVTSSVPVDQPLPGVTWPADNPETAAVTLATPRSRAVERVDVGHYDIPATALMAYQRAADIIAKVKPSCDLPWTLLAAIGRVESDHGRFAGATLSSDGLSSPRVVGIALNGKGPVAAIPDTDGGRWDGDTEWDHAVGPMQFLPSTWSLVGVDADGDGVRSIDDINDAALGAGVYLCAGAEQGLSSAAAMQKAVYRYNDSDEYVALVMAYESLYAGGDFEVVTPSDGVLTSTAVLSGPALGGVPLTVSRAVEAQVKAAVKQAIASTKKKHGTSIQRSAGTRVTSGKKTTVKVTTASTGGTTENTSGGGGSGSGTPSAGPTPSTGTGSGGGGTGGGTDAGGSGTGTTSPSGPGGATGGSTDGGSSSTPDQQPPSDTASPTPDGQDSQTPSPSPDPTPTPSTVTGLVTEQSGAYYLDGKLLELGVLASSDATAAGDFDGDGAAETNGAELAGLVGKTVTMVVVERSDGSLGIYSINGISLS
jgi:hypothetical protein